MGKKRGKGGGRGKPSEPPPTPSKSECETLNIGEVPATDRAASSKSGFWSKLCSWISAVWRWLKWPKTILIGSVAFYLFVSEQFPGPDEPTVLNSDPKDPAAAMFTFKNRSELLPMKSVWLSIVPKGPLDGGSEIAEGGEIRFASDLPSQDDFSNRKSPGHPRAPINIDLGGSLQAMPGEFIAPSSWTNNGRGPLARGGKFVAGSTITWVVDYKALGWKWRSKFRFLLAPGGDGLYWKIEPRE